MSLDEFGDLIVCSSLKCASCELGRKSRFDPPLKHINRFSEDEIEEGKHLQRVMGFGYEGCPIILVGEYPRDIEDDSANHGAFGVAEAEFLSKTSGPLKPVLRAVQRVGIPSRAVYSTSAIKCAVPKGAEAEARHKSSCLVNHLGVEIEHIEPAVIWVTGAVGMDMVRRHFKPSDVPKLSPGQFHIFKAPKIWRFQTIMILRTHHPSQVKIGTASYEGIEMGCLKMMDYLANAL